MEEIRRAYATPSSPLDLIVRTYRKHRDSFDVHTASPFHATSCLIEFLTESAGHDVDTHLMWCAILHMFQICDWQMLKPGYGGGGSGGDAVPKEHVNDLYGIFMYLNMLLYITDNLPQDDQVKAQCFAFLDEDIIRVLVAHNQMTLLFLGMSEHFGDSSFTYILPLFPTDVAFSDAGGMNMLYDRSTLNDLRAYILQEILNSHLGSSMVANYIEWVSVNAPRKYFTHWERFSDTTYYHIRILDILRHQLLPYYEMPLARRQADAIHAIFACMVRLISRDMKSDAEWNTLNHASHFTEMVNDVAQTTTLLETLKPYPKLLALVPQPTFAKRA